jgi:hypothetical protein
MAAQRAKLAMSMQEHQMKLRQKAQEHAQKMAMQPPKKEKPAK